MPVSKVITIATLHPNSDGVQRLLKASRALNVNTQALNIKDVNALTVLNKTDLLIVRIGPKSASLYTSLLTDITNDSSKQIIEAALLAFDKCASYEIMSKNGIPMPRSIVLKELNSHPAFLPGVLKVALGNQGEGVSLVTDESSYKQTTSEYLKKGNCLYQQYIPESNGSDKRLIICDNKFVAAMTRQAAEGDFRANLHRGGSAIVYTPTANEIEMAIEAVATLNLPYGGVDIIDSNDGPLILEVNPSPGLRISDITGVDVATEIINAIKKDAR